MKEIAQFGSLIIYSLSIVFHLLVLIQIIPYKMVWGGRLKSDTDMYKFEAVSLTVNLLFLFILLVQSNYVALSIPGSILTYVFWGMAALFLLNTAGNLLSKNRMEQMIFTPITLLLTFFSVVLAMA
jgi:hypothetical protein